jgi:hypothetical protein
MTGTNEKVTLTVDGVNACDRELLNSASGINGESRGDVLSRLIREYAVQTYGQNTVDSMIQRFENKRIKKQQYNEAAQPHSLEPPSFEP